MNKNYFLLCILSIFSWDTVCSSAYAKSGEVSSAPNKDASSPTTTSKEIETELTQHADIGDYYSVEITPQSLMLLEAKARESAKKNLLTPKETEAEVKKQKVWVAKETCFLFKIEALTIDYAKFEYWKAKLELNGGKLIPIGFGKGTTPNYTTGKGTTKWWSFNIACVRRKVDLSKGFKIHVMPQFDQPNVTLEWKKAD